MDLKTRNTSEKAEISKIQEKNINDLNCKYFAPYLESFIAEALLSFPFHRTALLLPTNKVCFLIDQQSCSFCLALAIGIKVFWEAGLPTTYVDANKAFDYVPARLLFWKKKEQKLDTKG